MRYLEAAGHTVRRRSFCTAKAASHNLVRARHANALGGGWQIQREVAFHAAFFAGGVDGILDGEEHGGSHEERRLTHGLGGVHSLNKQHGQVAHDDKFSRSREQRHDTRGARAQHTYTRTAGFGASASSEMRKSMGTSLKDGIL